MKIKTATKQFDLNHIRVDEKLQGAHLASFSRRLVAFAIDWLIIWACTSFILLIIPVVLAFLFFKGKIKSTFVKGNRYIRRGVLILERRLEENTTIQPELKRRFSKGIAIYLYIMLYLPIVVSLLYLGLLVVEYFYPQQYTEISTQSGSLLHVFTQPIVDLSSSLGLLSKFFGAFLYFSLFTWKWNGQTPGKRLVQISVVKLNGSRMTLWNSIERVSGYTASASIVFLGFFQYFWDKNAQTTHDKITETIVIKV